MKRVLVLLCFICFSQFSKAQVYVKDQTNLLIPNEIQRLESKLDQYEKQTSHEIAIRFVSSLEGETVEDYANRLFNDLGIGKKGKDNGILILAAFSDRKLRIEVGYGLESAVPDQAAAFIIDEVLTPHFKEREYYEGFDIAIDRIFELIENPAMLAQMQETATKRNRTEKIYLVIFWIIVIIIIILIIIYSINKNDFSGGSWTYSSGGSSIFSGGSWGGFGGGFGGGSSGGGGASGGW